MCCTSTTRTHFCPARHRPHPAVRITPFTLFVVIQPRRPLAADGSPGRNSRAANGSSPVEVAVSLGTASESLTNSRSSQVCTTLHVTFTTNTMERYWFERTSLQHHILCVLIYTACAGGIDAICQEVVVPPFTCAQCVSVEHRSAE